MTSNKIFHRLAAFGLLLGLAAASSAMTTREDLFTCPIGGEQFKQLMAGSGTAYGSYLDTRPYGAIESPWPLPVCPGNGFVIFKHDFTPEELTKLTAVVESDDYRQRLRTEPPYARAAFLMTVVGAEHRPLAFTLLKATWQSYSGEQADRYRAQIIEHLDQAPKDKPEVALNDQLIAGEMERRIGRFDDARRRFQSIVIEPGPRAEMLNRIVAYQLRLIAAKDTQTHMVPTNDNPESGVPPEPMRPRH
ncbi:hypothetical protein ACQ859_15235 [Roseateles chitinivorans]|uniref:hypothetical protein n=1 Tax=Roseateles chitinivorans TaxID=2917965 RepID=UPI003D676223